MAMPLSTLDHTSDNDAQDFKDAPVTVSVKNGEVDAEYLGTVGHDAVTAGWDKSRQRKLFFKVDLHVLPPLIALYLISFIDRGTLANASILGLKKSLDLDTTKYNLVATVFLFTYVVFEIPSNILLQKVRPSIWISIITFAWGVCTVCSGLVQNYAGALAARIFLGVTEAGFFPGAVFLVSMWYPREQLQYRISVFFSMGALAGSFSGLIAYGVAHMKDVGGLASWRWLFLLEGMVTCSLAPLVYFVLPDSPLSAKWLTDDEKRYLGAVSVSSGSGGAAHVPFRKKDFVDAVTDPKIWLCGLLGVGCNVPIYGFSYSLPTVLVQLGYTAEIAQLMTVPLYAVGALFCITTAIISDKIGRRAPAVIIAYSLGTIGLIAEFALPKDRMATTRYGFLFFIPAGFYAGYPASLAWQANNAAGRGKRAMSTALALSIGNISAAVGTNIYLGREAPHYKTGYSISIAAAVLAISAAVLNWYICARDNKKKRNMVVTATAEELEAMGDKSPTFRYMY